MLLLPGSGPVDRNSDHRRMRLGITGQLATAVTEAGMVTLRYDKRGVGASTGSWKSTGLQVDPDDLQKIAELVPGPVESHRVADVSHILRAQEGQPSLSRYKKDVTVPVDPRVVDLVVSWLGRHSR